MVALLDVVSLTPSLAGDSGLSMEMQDLVWMPFYIAVKGAEHKNRIPCEITPYHSIRFFKPMQ